MDVTQLESILTKHRDAEGAAMRATILEISASLADIVQQLEKAGPESADRIATALKGLRMGDVHTPAVNVAVPAPVVQIMPATAAAGWEFTHEYGSNGAIKKSIARPIKP